ncbi:MAG: hypothetical protein ABW252_09200 [Polyangiales bacterium]
MLGLLTCGACLVTKDVDFSVDNSPPAVIGAVGDLKPEKLARVPEVSDPKCPVVADAIFMRFEAKIVDIDVDQTLQARLLVNGNPVGQGQRQIGPAPMNARERNFQPFCINADDLRSPCNLVELIVSSAFDPLAASDPYATVLPDDLGHYEWWVIGSAASQADVRPADCFATVQPRDGGIP